MSHLPPHIPRPWGDPPPQEPSGFGFVVALVLLLLWLGFMMGPQIIRSTQAQLVEWQEVLS